MNYYRIYSICIHEPKITHFYDFQVRIRCFKYNQAIQCKLL